MAHVTRIVGDRGTGKETLLRLAARPSGWRRVRLFGASASAPHVRRQVDLITLGFLVAFLFVVVGAASTTDGVEAALDEVLRQLPNLFDPFWAIAYDLLAVAALASYALALVRGRWRLACAMTATILVSLVGTALVNDAFGVGTGLDALQLGSDIDGAPVQLVVALAMTSVAARELSRPFRTASRRLVLAGTIGVFLLPATTPFRNLSAVLLGLAVAALIRYAFGSPVSSVSAGDIEADLADLGTVATPDGAWAEGVHEAVTPGGDRIGVRVMGRDEWDNQLAVLLWRFLWYRHSGARLVLNPRQRVEHHAFLLLLADARGAPVTPVVAAGTSETGDGVVAFLLEGRTLASLPPEQVDDALLDRCWAALGSLHDAGIVHDGIDGRSLRCHDDGRVVLGEFDDAHQIDSPSAVHADRAQLLVATALAAGTERAVRAALRAIDAEAAAGGTGDAEDAAGEADRTASAAALVSFLQSAALDSQLRADVALAGLSLEEVRTSVAEAAGIEVPDLQKIWRVSWGSLVRLGLLGLVGYLLISQLADIGWETIKTSVEEAEAWLLLLALLFGQVPRVAQAASLQTASPTPVPLGRVTRLQFATSFINLAVPSTAARVATSIRFFQRSGATPAGAVSAGALDSVAGFMAQITLLGGLLLAGFGTLGWTGLPESTDRVDLVRVLLILAGIVAVLVVVVVAVPALRTRAKHIGGQLRESLTTLRSPTAVVRLLAWNLAAELLFSITIWIVLQAFGQDVSFADVVIINEAVALFAGLMPVPGGVGITEGALTAGFVAVGVPEAVAFSAAICYRMCTFYLPPIWGWFAFNSLRRDGYL
jgi:uncharacterized protein (TIRG00374 family)